MTVLSDLSHLRIWCAWRDELLPDRLKPTKVPRGAAGLLAESNNPATWLTRPEADYLDVQLAKPFGTGGVGLFLGALLDGTPDGLTLAGIDFDRCAGDGVFEDWALAGIQAIGSYCEISPSWTGAKSFVLVRPSDLPALRVALGVRRGGTGRKFAQPGRDHPKGVEVYLERRFFTVTGEHVEGMSPADLRLFTAVEATALLEVSVRPLLGAIPGAQADIDPSGPRPEAAPVEDAALRELFALRPVLERLWRGDPSAVGDDKSRSAFAYRLATELRGAGLSEGEMYDVLRSAPSTTEWVAEKGESLGGRELSRTWHNAEPAPFEAVGVALPKIEGLSSTDRPVGSARKQPDAVSAADALAASLKPKAAKSRPDEDTVVPEPPSASTDGRPVVAIRVPVHEVVVDAEAAVIAAGQPVFQRGGELMRPYMITAKSIDKRDTMTAAFKSMDRQDIIQAMSRAANFVRWNGREKVWTRCNPTADVADMWLSSVGEWRVPPVTGIITVPTLRPDGSLLHQPGYDRVTGLYLMPDTTVDLPAGWDQHTPTKADAEVAAKKLEALISESPFVQASDRSVALSAMITPVLRGMLSARPLHAFTAPEAGTGKSFLIDVCTAIALGRPAPVSTIGKTEEETEKRLGTMAMSGVPVGVLDNVNGKLEGDIIAQLTDRPSVRVRVLGLSKDRTVENGMCLFANGNNLTVVGDLVRRTITCTLDSEMESPETRVFSGDPLAEVMANRGAYLAAVLTIVRAHVLAGCPGASLPSGASPLASFADWDRHVRGSLRWLGYADPVESQIRTRRSDPERADLRLILAAWRTRFGVGDTGTRSLREVLDGFMGISGTAPSSSGHGAALAALVTRPPANDTIATIGGAGAASGGGSDVTSPELREAVLRVAGVRGVVDVTRFGNWMRRHEGRVMGGLKFVLKNTVGRTQGWTVETSSAHLSLVAGAD